MDNPICLNELRGLHRWFVTAFLVVITAGYLTGAYFVLFTTEGTPSGAVQQFRGNEEVPLEETSVIKYAKSDLEMLNIIHTHTTSFALIFFAVGGLFLCSSYSLRLKALLALEPFAATLALFGGMALLRYVPPVWAFPVALIMMIAGLSTFLCVAGMTMLSLWDMWRPNGPPMTLGARKSY